jgi:ABC-type Fe3+/spermidine/putrescine transport system ATPase subunit
MSDQFDQPLIRLNGISKSFGDVVAVEPLDLEIRSGDFFAILGPSGCGKTTLLNMIAGFLPPTTGRIEIAGQDVTSWGPNRRPTNMVFQGYGLFPHMNVRQNVGYGLRLAKKAKAEIDQRVREVLQLVHMEAFEMRRVTELSGGQQQRVALARALVMRPQVLLLDEPLAALDLKLRKAMQSELRRIHRSIGGTFVFVTHDQEEAMGLANRIAVMEGGQIVQEGRAEDIYARPLTRFVATFIGEANLLPGVRKNGTVKLDLGPTFVSDGTDGPIITVVRPEAVTISPLPATLSKADGPAFEARIQDMVFLGTYVQYVLMPQGKDNTLLVQSSDPMLRERLAIGDVVQLSWGLDQHRVLLDR